MGRTGRGGLTSRYRPLQTVTYVGVARRARLASAPPAVFVTYRYMPLHTSSPHRGRCERCSCHAPHCHGQQD